MTDELYTCAKATVPSTQQSTADAGTKERQLLFAVCASGSSLCCVIEEDRPVVDHISDRVVAPSHPLAEYRRGGVCFRGSESLGSFA